MKFIQDWMQWGWVNNYRTPGLWNCVHLLKLHWQAHQIRHLLSNHTFIDLMRAYNKAQKQSIIATIISSTTWTSWIIHINKNKPILAFLTNIESVLHFQSFTYLTTTTQSGMTLPTEGNLQLFKAAFRIIFEVWIHVLQWQFSDRHLFPLPLLLCDWTSPQDASWCHFKLYKFSTLIYWLFTNTSQTPNVQCNYWKNSAWEFRMPTLS